MRTDEMLNVHGIVDDMEDEVTRLTRAVSTLEITRIKRTFPFHDERAIYEIAQAIINIRAQEVRRDCDPAPPAFNSEMEIGHD